MKSHYYKIIFCLFIFSFSFTFSQQPTQEWVARIPGPTNNDVFGPFLQVDKNGNSYVAGTKVINDTLKVFCSKFNTDGVQQWTAIYIYPNEAYIRPTGLALDSSGNAYVIAEQGPAYYLPTNGLIVKFNSSSGNASWVKRYIRQYGWGPFRDIKIDKFNNIYVVGFTDSSHLVIRFNTNGDTLWSRKYNPPWLTNEVTRSCTIDDSMNVIFTGQRRFYYPPYGYYDSLLIGKYSPTGVLRWESVYAYNLLGSDIGLNITNDQLGNIFIGGATTISGFTAYLTMKYDRNGFKQWSKLFYGNPINGDNTIKGVALDRLNNNIYVTGAATINSIQMATTVKYNTISGDSLWVRKDTGNYKYGDARSIKLDTSSNIYITGVTSNTGSGAAVDLFTIKYSNSGNRNWLMSYNGLFSGLDIGKEIGIDEQNNIYVLGQSQSSSQISDYVIIKYNQVSGVNPISNIIPYTFKLEQNYPNPFNPTTKIRFSIPKSSNIQIKIFDVLGRIKEFPVNEKLNPSEYEFTLDASNYASGVYFYQLISDERVRDTKKFILLK